MIVLDLRAPFIVKGDNFTYLRLRGKLSHSLLELQQLNYLDLSDNDFGYSTIPKFIGSSPKLQHLVLNSANLSETIPQQLENLTKLRFLDLSSTVMNMMNVVNL